MNLDVRTSEQEAVRLKIAVRGAVQGVGFRPFVFRLAEELALNGWVNNSPQGVFMEAEGPRSGLERFLARLESDKPPRSSIQSLEASWLDPVGYSSFEIRDSEVTGSKTALVLPDIATCPDCLREILDPSNRRYFYPFTNCTNCGPRFSIIEALPYDRANTSMKQFTMCPQCQAEYENPRDRRFHAQPNACPVCGPHIKLWDRAGKQLTTAGPAGNERTSQNGEETRRVLMQAADAVRQGQIVAVKGLGGFHLMAAAANEEAIRRLRERKHREEKPFALMFPSLSAVLAVCEVSTAEERLLRSPEAPIVLLRKRSKPDRASAPPAIAPLVAPGNPYLGVMLPYTPLHHLLLSLLEFPVVATSGNLSDEPICTDEHEALERLQGIADLFLVHNRPILRHVDDSITRLMVGRELVLRRARGFAPLPIHLHSPARGLQSAATSGTSSAVSSNNPSDVSVSESVLAVGAHLKNTIALSVGPHVFISQHIGDLETEQAYDAFRRVIADFKNLYESAPQTVVADMHPDYLSTKFAREMTPDGNGTQIRRLSVQHHLAHALSCMAENELEPPVLGVSWDGTGYGLDGTIWGGEFFRVTETDAERAAHFRCFPLPGGDKAIREPRRTALGLLFQLFGQKAFGLREPPSIGAFSPAELSSLQKMLERQINSPLTSSVGRLFDAVASLCGLRQRVRFEGQAAMELEFALDGIHSDEAYSIELTETFSADLKSHIPNSKLPLVLDWQRLIQEVLNDVRAAAPPGLISVKFHNALAESIVAVARRMGIVTVVLSGGCFQNRYLTERTIARVSQTGFRPYWHQRVPPNDGGIALGQVMAAARNVRLLD